jgi:hypothetical protein
MGNTNTILTTHQSTLFPTPSMELSSLALASPVPKAQEEPKQEVKEEKKEPEPKYPVGSHIIAKDKKGGIYCATVIKATPDTITVKWPGWSSDYENFSVDSDEIYSIQATLDVLNIPRLPLPNPVELAKCILVLMRTEKKYVHLGHLETNRLGNQEPFPWDWKDINDALNELCKESRFCFRLFWPLHGNFASQFAQWTVEQGHEPGMPHPEFHGYRGSVVVCLMKKTVPVPPPVTLPSSPVIVPENEDVDCVMVGKE